MSRPLGSDIYDSDRSYVREKEDEEKMQCHDMLDDGRLEGGVVVYVLWREKRERLMVGT